MNRPISPNSRRKRMLAAALQEGSAPVRPTNASAAAQPTKNDRFNFLLTAWASLNPSTQRLVGLCMALFMIQMLIHVSAAFSVEIATLFVFADSAIGLLDPWLDERRLMTSEPVSDAMKLVWDILSRCLSTSVRIVAFQWSLGGSDLYAAEFPIWLFIDFTSSLSTLGFIGMNRPSSESDTCEIYFMPASEQRWRTWYDRLDRSLILGIIASSALGSTSAIQSLIWARRFYMLFSSFVLIQKSGSLVRCSFIRLVCLFGTFYVASLIFGTHRYSSEGWPWIIAFSGCFFSLTGILMTGLETLETQLMLKDGESNDQAKFDFGDVSIPEILCIALISGMALTALTGLEWLQMELFLVLAMVRSLFEVVSSTPLVSRRLMRIVFLAASQPGVGKIVRGLFSGFSLRSIFKLATGRPNNK